MKLLNSVMGKAQYALQYAGVTLVDAVKGDGTTESPGVRATMQAQRLRATAAARTPKVKKVLNDEYIAEVRAIATKEGWIDDLPEDPTTW